MASLRMPVVVIVLLATLALLLGVAPRDASGMEATGPRHALVIGNAAYDRWPLRNPRNDADDIARVLGRIGFEVSVHHDLDGAGFDRALDAFFDAVTRPDAVVLLFYAGHAVQLRGRNYLLPVGAEFGSAEELIDVSLALQDVFDRMRAAGTAENLVILDACRDNPFADEDDLADDGLADLPGGLAPVEAPPGTFVAYATEPGSYAADGRRRNGTYTHHLLRFLDDQEPVETVFHRVRRAVVRETDGDQVPWEHSSLFDTLYLHPRQNRRVPPVHAF